MFTRAAAYIEKIDATGFEPAASASRTQRSTKLSHTSIRYKSGTTDIGFEPILTESESVVLPLHQSASATLSTQPFHYTIFEIIVKGEFAGFL